MEHLRFKEFFIAALRESLKGTPRGTQTRMAMKAGVAPGVVSDMLSGRTDSSEENRRALAYALGWNYNQFILFGKSLIEGKPFSLQRPIGPLCDSKDYVVVPLFSKLVRALVDKKYFCRPDPEEDNTPVLIPKILLGRYVNKRSLAAFKMPDDNMAPTIRKDGLAIIDLEDTRPADQSIFGLSISAKKPAFTVHKIQTEGDSGDIYLKGENPAARSQLLKESWESIVVGRVIMSWSLY